jgi:hypothetical protein
VVTGRATRDLLPLLRLDPGPEIWGPPAATPPPAPHRVTGSGREGGEATAPTRR